MIYISATSATEPTRESQSSTDDDPMASQPGGCTNTNDNRWPGGVLDQWSKVNSNASMNSNSDSTKITGDEL